MEIGQDAQHAASRAQNRWSLTTKNTDHPEPARQILLTQKARLLLPSPAMKFLTLLILLALGRTAFAAETVPAVSLENTEQRSITAQKIGQRYDLLISLPADYATSGKSYPVLYVLDGWHFALMAFLQENNPYSGRMQPVIMVNLSYGKDPAIMTLRARDFLPTKSAEAPFAGGGAADFLAFLEKELIPYIDRTYRTIPTDRGLLGHSYGGAFAIYALEQRPDLFQRIVAASPSLHWDHEMLIKAAPERFKNFTAHVRLDLSTGTENDNAVSITAFANVLDQLKPPGLDARYMVYPGENHNSVRLLSIPSGLYWVYRPGETK
jgi:predicted alpha/beta superfamily hydrolase